MRLGFYYHIPIRTSGPKLFTAGALGCFLDRLAQEVDELILFLHEAEAGDPHMDYHLTSKNITYVSLGLKPHAVWRTFFGDRLLRFSRDTLAECDMMLVRGPTHLFQSWGKACRMCNVKMTPLLVGDYRAGNANLCFTFPKQQIVKLINWWVDRKEKRLLKGATILVNSQTLEEKYRFIAREIYQVRTTTLREDSFFDRSDTCQGEYINLLYTGRFDWQKGLQELMDSFVYLAKKDNHKVILNLVGWQDDRGPSIQKELTRQAKKEGLTDRVIFHGKKKIGPDLNRMYQMADIYIIPSYAEGFPRTIWEAMANSCPVIATKVGGIPALLENREHALLVRPKNSAGLLCAARELINNQTLRQRLISKGMALALANTLEAQSKRLSATLHHIEKKS